MPNRKPKKRKWEPSKIISDPNCPPGRIYLINPDYVQVMDENGKVTKPFKKTMDGVGR